MRAVVGCFRIHRLRRESDYLKFRTHVDCRKNLIHSGRNLAWRQARHKTRSVFDRHNIVSPDDLKQASGRMETHLRARGPAAGTIWGKRSVNSTPLAGGSSKR
jgi:hypothetical protein